MTSNNSSGNDNILTDVLIEHDLWEHLANYCSYEMLQSIKTAVGREVRKIVHNVGMPIVLGFQVVSVKSCDYRINISIEGAVHGSVRVLLCAINEDTLSLVLWEDYYSFNAPNTIVARTMLIAPKWRSLFNGKQIEQIDEFLSKYDKLVGTEYTINCHLVEDAHRPDLYFRLEVVYERQHDHKSWGLNFYIKQ